MPKINRGDVFTARITQDGFTKVRPVVVVQNDRNNARLSNVIVAMITSNTKLAGKEATQVLIDLATPEGKQAGLVSTSAVKCENIYTTSIKRLKKKLGTLSDTLLQEVDAALKASLDLK